MGSVTKRMDVVAGRKYQTKSGEEKTHWINVGEAAEWDDGGISIKLHAVPVGSWFDGSLRLFERKEQQQRGNERSEPKRQESSVPAGDEFSDSDIPF